NLALLCGMAVSPVRAESPLLQQALSGDVIAARQAQGQIQKLDATAKKEIVRALSAQFKTLTYLSDQSRFVGACQVLEELGPLSQPALPALGAQLMQTASYGERQYGADSTIMRVFAAAGATPETESLMLKKLDDPQLGSDAVKALATLPSERVVR